jgi:hypothetical protein
MEDAMSPDPFNEDIKTLWQKQYVEDFPMTLAEVQQKAEKFDAKIRRRNLWEYLAGAVTIPIFAWYVWIYPGWMMRTGNILIIVAALVVMWQIRRRASAETCDGNSPIVESYRSSLLRQRKALGTVWIWYIAPFVPGMALTLLARYLQAPVDQQPMIIASAVITALTLIIIGLVNMLAANRLQKRIDELDRVKTED